jgi:hypothetical protein
MADALSDSDQIEAGLARTRSRMVSVSASFRLI